jgi:hypothetical protein
MQWTVTSGHVPCLLSATFTELLARRLFQVWFQARPVFRVIVPEGEINCASYEMVDNGIELYDEEEQFIGFVPFTNLREVMNEEIYSPRNEDRSIY